MTLCIIIYLVNQVLPTFLLVIQPLLPPRHTYIMYNLNFNELITLGKFILSEQIVKKNYFQNKKV